MSEHRMHHEHSPQLTNVSRAFLIGIILNSVFVLIEFVAGFYTNSLALLSDASHNLSDVASLGLALFAYKISKAKSTLKFTYGFHKSTILVSLVNAVVLLIAVGSIGWEAIQRFMKPEEAQGGIISIIAGIGIIINSISAFLFFRDRKRDINIRGAYLHLAFDAILSLGVVVAGILILITGIKWIDPAISLALMLVVTISTWKILVESLRLTLDAVPENLNMNAIKYKIEKISGIKNVHHIHVWAISTSKNAMTAHIVLEDGLSEMRIVEIKQSAKLELQHLNIHHTTFETELQGCSEEED